MGNATVDVLIKAGFIVKMEANIKPKPDIETIDGLNQLLLPGLVNAHAHVDKNLLGLGWHSYQVPERRISDLVNYERNYRLDNNISAKEQSAKEIEAASLLGVTHIRSHVDIDTDAGLQHFEGVLETKEAYQDCMTMQLVAFPQSGMLIRRGTVDLLEEAIKLGAECIGGLDPSVIDRDPVKHLDTIFALADRHGVELDIHLHEPSKLGAFAVELIAERTKALGLQGKVVISHCFCLGQIDEAHLDDLITMLLENQIAIMSLGSANSNFPPIKKLYEAGVLLCTGTDGVRDTWGPYNGIDMLERVKLLGYRSGFYRDEEVEMLLDIATYGGAKVMKDDDYGLEVGKRADLVVVAGHTPTHAVVDQPGRNFVIKSGKIVAQTGSSATQ